MQLKTIFCVTWTLLANTMVSVSSSDTPNPFKDLPEKTKCIDATNVCSLGLKCNAGMMFEVPIQGLMGPPGPVGERGLSGEPGATGDPGPQGMPGETGAYGLPGEVGLPGERGPVGEPGPRGERGDRGDRGSPGPSGEMGFQGEPGETGPPGPSGERGRPGESGPVGEPGRNGERGIDGPRGEVGPHGETGRDGFPGERGPEGPPGPPGKSNGCRLAFQAGVQKPKDYSQITTNTPLAFDRVSLNIEGGFIPSNGKFIAPFKGTFNFHVSVAAQEGKLGAIIVQHNEKHIGTVYADSRTSWGAASNTYVFKLEDREEVRFLVAKSAPNLYGSMYTSVSGTCVWRDE